jgi:hypothetical protein
MARVSKKEYPMFMNRAIVMGLLAAGTILSTAAVAPAEHLERRETRRIIRGVEEASMTLFDRIDDWTEQRWDERYHQLDELDGRINDFQTAVNSFTSQLRTHEEPWDVRDGAKAIVDASTELGRSINHADYLPRELRRDWEGLRDRVDELANHFHLPPVESR